MSARKILIADDDRDLVRILAMTLMKAGFQVFGALDGCQAVEFAHRHTPDLYILDVNMPAGNGLSVQERIQKSLTLCMSPVIYLTGDKRPEVIKHAMKLGAFSVLYKPVESDELLHSVRSALRQDAA